MFQGDPSMMLRRHAEARRDAQVRLACVRCGSGHDVQALRAIWLLRAFGLGDELSAVSACAKLDDHACVRCGGRRWEAWPVLSEPPR